MDLGIDASRNRSGGARAHLKGILRHLTPGKFGIERVHLWSYPALLNEIDDCAWLHKHSPPELEMDLARQLRWQAFGLPSALVKLGCELLFTTDSSSLCHSFPAVVLNQDLLSYETGSGQRRSDTMKGALRSSAIRLLQTRALRKARGAIFLTDYARDTVTPYTGPLRHIQVIPHGVDEVFRVPESRVSGSFGHPSAIRIGYVSPFSFYKHQLEVIEAATLLRSGGYPIRLELIGNIEGQYGARVRQLAHAVDPNRQYIKIVGPLSRDDLPNYMKGLDVHVFASSCEAFGITLLEAMSTGRPVACSSLSSMGETLRDGGVYFDPLRPASIRDAVASLLNSSELRQRVARRAVIIASAYSWERCSAETFSFIQQIAVSCANGKSFD